MSDIDNGGQAFPTGDHTNGGHDGMSLRDWFAGQALAGMIVASSDYQRVKDIADGVQAGRIEARAAYAIADAMLAARKEPTT